MHRFGNVIAWAVALGMNAGISLEAMGFHGVSQIVPSLLAFWNASPDGSVMYWFNEYTRSWAESKALA